MKLVRAQIYGFGKLIEQTYEFYDGLQLIFGANESGKSTLYSFIDQMLFGFETAKKSNRHFRPKRANSSFGGQLVLDIFKYGEVVIERKGIKGKEKTRNNAEVNIYLADGQSLSEEEFWHIIRPLNIELFHSVYSLKQEQLLEIRLMREETIEGTLLAIASTGSRELIKKAKVLQEDAEKLFAKKGSVRPINAAMQELFAIRKKIVQKEQEESIYQEVQKQLLYLDKKIEENRASFKQKDELLNFLQKQLQAAEGYREWFSLKEKFKQNPLYDKTEVKRLKIFYQRYQQTKEELKESDQKYKVALTIELANKTENYSFYLKNKEKITKFLEQEVNVTKLTQKEQEYQIQLKQAVDTLIELSSRWKWQEDHPPDLLDYEEVEKIREEVLRLKFGNDILVDGTQAQLCKYSAKRDILSFIISIFFAGIGLLFLIFCASPWNFIYFFVISFLGIILTLLLRWGYQKNLEKVKKRCIENNDRKCKHLLKYFQQMIQQANLKEMKTFDDILRFYHQIETFHKMLKVRNQQVQLLKEIRAKLAKFDEETIFLNDWLPLINKHIKDKFKIVHSFVFDMEAISKENKKLDSSMIFDRIKSLEAKIDKFNLEADKFIKQYHLVNFIGIEEFLQKQQALEEAKIRYDFIFAQLKEIFDLTQPINFDEISKHFKEAKLEFEKIAEEYQRLVEEKARLKGEKAFLEKDGVLSSLIQDESYQLEYFRHLVKEWLIKQVETKVLIDLLRASRDQTLHELLKEASKLFSDLTSAQYVGIKLVEGALKLEDVSGNLFRVADLSTGARDQLYLAIRMAFLLHRNKHYAPILVDDGWLHYDEKRRGNLLKLFKEVAKKEQVILFSSDKLMHSLFLESNCGKVVEL
ncbi:MAG: AAA family ATPase [Streptococcaceae bacterium]|nr:AAA family ATPase [Streptococcaceae bacterium]